MEVENIGRLESVQKDKLLNNKLLGNLEMEFEFSSFECKGDHKAPLLNKNTVSIHQFQDYPVSCSCRKPPEVQQL